MPNAVGQGQGVAGKEGDITEHLYLKQYVWT